VSQPTGPAADELRRLIMAHSEPGVSPAAAARPNRSWSLRRRLAIATPIVAGLAAAAFAAFAVLPGASPVGPAPARADALTFIENAGYLDVRIADPAADPQRYNAELAAHGLKIELSLAPGEPEQVGRVIFAEENDNAGPRIKTVEAPGNCTANGNCSVAIRVPLDYRGEARFVFGRTPEPGETIEGDAPVLSSEQKAQLKALRGKRVTDVRELLAAHGQTATYRVGFESLEATADQVPGDWYVYDTAPLANNKVVLWVSKDGKEPAPKPLKS
jgi:hypothetical protein